MVFPVYLPDNIDTSVYFFTFWGINNPMFNKGVMGDYFRRLSDLFTRTEDDENQRCLCSSFWANYILDQYGTAKYGNQDFKFKYDGVLYPCARICAGEIS